MLNNFKAQYIKSANIKLDRDLKSAQNQLNTQQDPKPIKPKNTWLKVKNYFKKIFS